MTVLNRTVSIRVISFWMAALLIIVLPQAASTAPSADDILNAVIQVDATIPGTARTAAALGTERQGSGIVIDSSGLVLTIGYLILEARDITLTDRGGRTVPASIVAYDYGTGFGLLRAMQPLGIHPVQFGDSGATNVRDVVLAVGRGGRPFRCESRPTARSPDTGSICSTMPSSRCRPFPITRAPR